MPRDDHRAEDVGRAHAGVAGADDAPVMIAGGEPDLPDLGAPYATLRGQALGTRSR
jgi:hypothetical protein